ncbi:EamA family transporter [Alicyclobacillus curvatus]|jgi:drug/metabolite transporter (DMT)-like permease|nr:EamA family transporter [Alicyclobacillus curvatus]
MIGIIMVLIGSTLWGISGTAAQKLFQHDGFSAGWLVDVRMGLSGIVLLLSVWLSQGRQKLLAVWKSGRDSAHLIGFAFIGLLGVQYSYLASIEDGNAAMATFLQYLGPAFLLLYVTWRARRLPTRVETTAVILALFGTLLLVTNGVWGKIVVPPSAVIWGIISAVTLAIYTVSPFQLIRKYGSATVVGWAMLIGTVFCSFITPPWHVQGSHFTLSSFLLIGFVVVFGTLVAFYLYLSSTNYITPSETSLIACMEPLSAAVASVVWLHTRLGVATIVGGLCILITVVLLARKSAAPTA